MNRLWVAAVAWGLSAVSGGAVSPDPRDLKIPAPELVKAQVLVRKLGSESFREREHAQEELIKMGRLAKPVLVETLNTDSNPEVRSRSARILPRAEAADLQARIDTFLADAEGKFEHDLPVWTLFRKQVGDNRSARDLYVEMLKSHENLELLTALNVSFEEGGRAVADRRINLYLQMNPQVFGGRISRTSAQPQQPSLVDIATLLFAESVVPNKDVPRGGQLVFVTGAVFVQNQVSMNAINNPGNTPHAAPYTRILTQWLDSRTSPEDLNNIAYVANNLRQIKETTALLRRVVTTEGVQGWAKGQALMFLVQRNGKDEQPFLKTLLQADTVVTTVWLGNNRMGVPNQAPCQLRDVALAMLITQAGQDMKKYGFEFPPGVNPNPQNINFGTYAFTSDEQRNAAIKRWAEWEAAQQKKGQKDEPKKEEPRKK